MNISFDCVNFVEFHYYTKTVVAIMKYQNNLIVNNKKII